MGPSVLHGILGSGPCSQSWAVLGKVHTWHPWAALSKPALVRVASGSISRQHECPMVTVVHVTSTWTGLGLLQTGPTCPQSSAWTGMLGRDQGVLINRAGDTEKSHKPMCPVTGGPVLGRTGSRFLSFPATGRADTHFTQGPARKLCKVGTPTSCFLTPF